jgi:hypothetical protein
VKIRILRALQGCDPAVNKQAAFFTENSQKKAEG